MAKSMTERMKNWRNKKSALGGKSVTIMLGPESVQLLEELKERYHESYAKVITRALGCLAESFTCNQSRVSESFTCKQPENQNDASAEGHEPFSEGSSSGGGNGIHPGLKSIKEELDRGATLLSQKEELKKAMRVMRSQGFESSKIADFLQAAAIPTIKGNDRWDGGTIRKWWK